MELRPTGGATGIGPWILDLQDELQDTGPWILGLQDELRGQAPGS
jgi:hypothetical protein